MRCGARSGRASPTTSGRCGHITNGVHVPTWLSSEMAKLFDAHLASDWRDRHDEPGDLGRGSSTIPDEELWAARQALRDYLFAFIRERARQRWKEEHVSAARVVAAGTLLDPQRADDRVRPPLHRLQAPGADLPRPRSAARHPQRARRPVQIVFAGKAHPADETGKHHLQQVYRRAIDPTFGGRIAFVDDYDLHVAHFLVQGCDVWLNNPRKPLEASGTSGMKASINGVPHLSIGDGWWAEGYTGENGWLIEGRTRATAIPTPWTRPTPKRSISCSRARSCRRSTSATRTASRERWLSIVRQAIITVTPRFSARRMVKQYAEEMYAPALRPRQMTKP